jgi:hypothetical protein
MKFEHVKFILNPLYFQIPIFKDRWFSLGTHVSSFPTIKLTARI